MGPEAESVRLAASGFGAGLCEKFRLIETYTDPALVFVKLLPKGDRIAKVVIFPVKIANELCPKKAAAAEALRSRGAAPTAEPPPFGDVMTAFKALANNLDGPAERQEAISRKELCDIYKENKKWIATILSFVEWLPTGGTVAKVIRLIMQIADELCGA
jgi:hypothetical protein